MRRILATGGVVAAVIIASWHIVARFREMHRRLAATGELDQRRAARRRARIELEVGRARLRETGRRSLRQPVLVPVYASVQVGAVRDADLDIDDIGLLDASMRRAARAAQERPAVVRAPLPMVVPTRANDFTWLEQRPTTTRIMGPALLVVGAVATIVPLTRPLGGMAPWLALVALCMVVAGWVLVRDGD